MTSFRPVYRSDTGSNDSDCSDKVGSDSDICNILIVILANQDAWTESENMELAQISIGIGTVGTLTVLPDYLLI